MSYYASIYFKKVNNMEEAINVLNSFIKEYSSIDNMKQVVEDNRFYLYRDIYNSDLKLTKKEPWKYLTMLRHLFQPLLVFKGMYFPKYNLLGLCFYDPHKIVDKYFDGHIEFQNSCDQDYEYETWDILGDFFINKVEYFKNLLLLEVRKLLELPENEYDDEYEVKRLDYNRRSLMYDFVWKELDLDSWLWNKESKTGVFIPLNLCVPLTDDNGTLFFEIHKHFFKLFEEDNKKRGNKK